MRNNEKGASSRTKGEQIIVQSSHEAIGRNERIDTVIDSVMSEGKIIHEYLDDIIFYEEDNKENEMNHNVRGFINTNDIFNYLVPKKNEVEKPEIDITESHSDKVRTDSKSKKGEEGSLRELETDNNQVIGPESYEARIIDDPKQGGKTSNVVQTKLDVEPPNVLYGNNTLNSHILPNKADIINDDKDHEKNVNIR